MNYPVTYPTGQPNQVHHSYIWLGPLTATAAVLLATIGYNISSLIQLYRFLEDHGLTNVLLIALGAIVAFALVYAIVTIVYVLAWRNMRYVFDETEFSLYSGIITKRQVHVPYARVQSVNHRAGLVQRIFGVCSVSIDTAGGSSNKAVRVPYVTLADAERIRADLFVRKAAVEAGCASQLVVVDPEAQAAAIGAQQAGIFDTQAQRAAAPVSPQQLAAERAAQLAQPDAAHANLLDDAAQQVSTWRGAFGGAVAGMEPASFQAGLDNSQLLLTGLSAMGTEGAVISLGISGALLGILANAAFMEPWMVGMGMLITAGMLVVGLLAGLISAVFSYGNFQVRRRGSRIEVERGLLQRVFTGIDIERVQSVVIKQSFVRRCLGYCEVSLGRINAGQGDANAQANKQALNQGGLVVHPFLRLDQAQDFLAQLLPECADMPDAASLHPLPDVALRRGLLRQGVWRNPMLWTSLGYAVLQAILHGTLGASPNPAGAQGLAVTDQIGLALYVFAFLSTIVTLVDTVLWKKGSGHVLSPRYLAVRNDGLHTDVTVVPRTKIQSGCTRTNPFQRAAGVTTLVATTAAGTRHTSTTLWDVTSQEGAAWLDWLKPHSTH